jgi:hypothetical protein
MNAVVFNTVNSIWVPIVFITDNLEKAQLSNLTSILKEKLSYIISCFIIWENFETQNTFSDSLYNVPKKENQGQMQIVYQYA